MTATAPAVASGPRPRRPHAATAPSLPDILRSEWTKLRSVRSTYWTLLGGRRRHVGLAALICSVCVSRFDQIEPGRQARRSTRPVQPERPVPGPAGDRRARRAGHDQRVQHRHDPRHLRRRAPAAQCLAAKATVFGAVTLVVGLVSCFAAFFIGQAILSAKHIEAHIGDPGVLRAVTGAGLYLAVLGLLALGIGALIRHSAGAIAAVFGLILVLPGLVGALPSSWERHHLAVPAEQRGRGDVPGGPRRRPLPVALGRIRSVVRLRRRGAGRRGVTITRRDP